MHLLAESFQPCNHFFSDVNELMQSLNAALKKFQKIIQITVVMECFHSKLADLLPEKKVLNRKGLRFA